MEVTGWLQVGIGAVEVCVVIAFLEKMPARYKWFIIGSMLIAILLSVVVSVNANLLDRVFNTGHSSLPGLQNRSYSLLTFAGYGTGQFKASPVRFRRTSDNDMQYQVELTTLSSDATISSTGIQIDLERLVDLDDRSIEFQLRLQNDRGENVGTLERYRLVEQQLNLFISDDDGKHEPFYVAFADFCRYDFDTNLLSCSLRGKQVTGIERERVRSLGFHVSQFAQTTDVQGLVRPGEQLLLTISGLRFVEP